VSTTGGNNTVLGYNVGNSITTGSNNTVLGFNADASSATVSNEITLGNSSIATLRCQVTSITALSDARDKTNVAPLHAGLDFVERLAPVSFDWNMRDGGKVGVADTGFIAQDLQQVQQDTGVEIPGLVFDNNPDKLEAAYGKLVPVLVQALKELSAKVTALEAQINS
jgi:trimeric autotransporter adhesin